MIPYQLGVSLFCLFVCFFLFVSFCFFLSFFLFISFFLFVCFCWTKLASFSQDFDYDSIGGWTVDFIHCRVIFVEEIALRQREECIILIRSVIHLSHHPFQRFTGQTRPAKTSLQLDLISHARQVTIQCHSQAHLDKCNIERKEASLKIIICILRKDGNAY